mmetsp:Transcript_17458/g.40945  ORF Transcript_17458/g.40945 Transcript_17458/m.40945 type:complete len:247 (+) Transcript_17458:28-768(+)|eukprot:s6006_g2.t1
MATEAAAAIKKVSGAGDDYYRILGIDKSANDVEIKKAYRKLALQLHPDKCKDEGAEEAFKRVGEAFSVLSDTEKRQRYDQYGVDAVKGGGSASPGFSPEDIFEAFFAGGMPGMRPEFGGGRNFVRTGPGTFVFTSGGPGGFSFSTSHPGMRRRTRAQESEEEDSGGAADSLPSWIAPLQAVAGALGPLLPIVVVFGFMFLMSVMSFIVQLLMSKALFVLPVMYLTEGKSKIFLLGGVLLASMVGLI